MALDREGITTAVKNCLEADTTTLFGNKKLLQLIDINPVNFSKAKVDIDKPNALYLWVADSDTIELRSQNNDVLYTINMRYESLYVNPNDGYKNIDSANKRVSLLLNTQVWNGQLLSAYYTDANAMIFDIVPLSNSLPPPVIGEGKKIIVEIEGALTITINEEI